MDKVNDFIFRGGEPRKFIEQLKRDGIQEIVCLQDGWFDLTDGKRDELKKMCDIYQIVFHEVPLSDFKSPTKEQTEKVLGLLHTSFLKSVKIYIHCLHGVDRTGWMIAAYRVRYQGYSVDAAVKEWHLHGFHSKWYFWWEKRFRKMMKEWA